MSDEARKVMCVKLGKELPGLKRPPFRNDLGQRLFESISEEAWSLWLAHSTMLINERRLDVADRNATAYLLEECEKFFFGEGSEMPEGYKPKADDHAGHDHAGHDHAGHDHKHDKGSGH